MYERRSMDLGLKSLSFCVCMFALVCPFNFWTSLLAKENSRNYHAIGGYCCPILQWRYSPGWALASFTIHLQASRSLALSLHSFIPIFLRSVDTSSSYLIFGLPLRLVAYSFPYNILFGITVSCILSIWPSHRILWLLINLTMFSSLIVASNSSFRRILHKSFSFTGP